MIKNQALVILGGALAITTLINIPRLLIALHASDLASRFGLTLGDVVLRTIVMFCFSWLVLSFNLVWRNSWNGRKIRSEVSTGIAINVGLLILGVTSLTLLKQLFFPGYLERRQLFVMTFFGYLVVHLILLLVCRVVHLNAQYQRSLFEKEQAKHKMLEQQLQALRAQINPHFLFNALGSLSALIRQKSENASTFVDKLSWLLRATLQRSQEDFYSLKDEMDYLEAYVFLQKERFGEKLNLDIRIPAQWQKEMIPSFSLQLLVENAIKHNVVSRQTPLFVEIFFEDDYLVVKNRIQPRRDAVNSTGTGLSNLSTRFQLLKGRDILIHKDDYHFAVKLPMIKDESSHN